MNKNEEGLWRVGVDASLQVVFEDPACPALLRQALAGPISWHARNETPVAQALKSPRLAPEWVAGLLALGATLIFESGAENSLTSLLQKEVAGEPTELRVALNAKRWGAARVARTPADEPIVAAVAGMTFGRNGNGDGNVVAEARLALVGAWSEAVRLARATDQLVGETLGEEQIEAVARALMREVAPQGDYLGSETYRREMAGVLARRALRACLFQMAEMAEEVGA
ncbi:MAG TPA: hypothetical protein ENN19_09580 [Chloroflexi bacterium]|nr:hypothetical protein [Chloroflexota bacterium]